MRELVVYLYIIFTYGGILLVYYYKLLKLIP